MLHAAPKNTLLTKKLSAAVGHAVNGHVADFATWELLLADGDRVGHCTAVMMQYGLEAYHVDFETQLLHLLGQKLRAGGKNYFPAPMTEEGCWLAVLHATKFVLKQMHRSTVEPVVRLLVESMTAQGSPLTTVDARHQPSPFVTTLLSSVCADVASLVHLGADPRGDHEDVLLQLLAKHALVKALAAGLAGPDHFNARLVEGSKAWLTLSFPKVTLEMAQQHRTLRSLLQSHLPRHVMLLNALDAGFKATVVSRGLAAVRDVAHVVNSAATHIANINQDVKWLVQLVTTTASMQTALLESCVTAFVARLLSAWGRREP